METKLDLPDRSGSYKERKEVSDRCFVEKLDRSKQLASAQQIRVLDPKTRSVALTQSTRDDQLLNYRLANNRKNTALSMPNFSKLPWFPLLIFQK